MGRHRLSWVLPADQPDLAIPRAQREHVHVAAVESLSKNTVNGGDGICRGNAARNEVVVLLERVGLVVSQVDRG